MTESSGEFDSHLNQTKVPIKNGCKDIHIIDFSHCNDID